MINFILHKKEVITNFCNSFKKGAYKDIWGISLNCNIKDPETVWLAKELLNYQTLSVQTCASGCTVQNPSFIITKYADCTKKPVFPTLFKFNIPRTCIPKGFPEFFQEGSGCCSTKVVVNNGSTVTTYNFTINSITNPIAGSTSYVFPSLIGYKIQLSLSGYGFFNPGPDGLIQYTFDSSTGTIILQGGLTFNLGEVYTIFAYK